MINKMYALHPHIPAEIISKFENAYDLHIGPAKAKNIINLCFKSQDGVFKLTGSYLEEYDSERNLTDTFFLSPSGNRVSPFPSLEISENNMRKKGIYSTKSKSYNKILRILKSNASINPALQGLLTLFTSEAELIFNEVDKYFKNLKKKTSVIFSIEIDGLSIGRSPFYESIRAKAAEDYYKDFYTLDDKTVEGSDLVCSLCFERKEKLWGYVSIYNFYTAKTEFAPIAGGFRKERAHNNFPVCPDCAQKLKQLKPVVDQYFKYRFCGFDYLLIPEYVGGPSEKETMDLIIEIMVSQHAAQPGELLDIRLGSFTLGKRKTIVESNSDEVFDYLAETKNTAAYTMIFYSSPKGQAKFTLLSSIDNVFPSQFKEIFAAKEKAESHAIFKDMPGKKGEGNYDLIFRFDLLKEFLPTTSEPKGGSTKPKKGEKASPDDENSANVSVGLYSKAFLEMTRSIFKQEQVSYSFLLRRIIAVIRKIFANEKEADRGYPTKIITLKAFLTLKFLYYLRCIIPNRHKAQKEVNVNVLYEEFFAEHQDFFDTNAKKSVFMTGVLTQHLLDIQYVDRGATPFRTRLNGLKLNPALIKRIFTEAIEKLKQYNKNYYRKLQGDIAQLMITGGMEELSNDEISFIFTLGMALNQQFKNQDQEKTEDEDEE